MNRARSGFICSFAATLGPALVAAFLQHNLVPAVIWLVTLALVLRFGGAR